MRGLVGLAEVARAAAEAAEARLAALRREDAALVAKVEAIETARAARAAQAVAGDPALMAGADLRWEAWAEARVEAIQRDRALLRARMEEAREALRLRFGRQVATEALAARARAERARQRERRAERG